MKKLYKVFILLFIFIFYFVFGHFTHIYIPCVFHMITGLLCPGCGVSRMIISIFHGDFVSAYYYNRLIFISSPIFIILFIDYVIKTIMNKKPLYMKIPNIVYYIYLVLLIIFMILRNIF